MTAEQPILKIENLVVNYGVINALREVSLEVMPGQIVTLIGSNGAGKTTTLRTISGLLRPKSGEVYFEGEAITKLAPHKVVGRGISHVPEGRMVFANLTVWENLRMGAYLRRGLAAIEHELELVYSIFPRLKERAKQMAGTLSGGEQQMLAIGRALMAKPKFLMLDEPSLGIAPLLVRSIFETIVEINRTQKLAILLVEQNANLALEISHNGYVLESGKITMSDDSSKLRNNPEIRKAYLGG